MIINLLQPQDKIYCINDANNIDTVKDYYYCSKGLLLESGKTLIHGDLENYLNNNEITIFRNNIQIFPMTMEGFYLLADAITGGDSSGPDYQMALDALKNDSFMSESDKLFIEKFINAVWRAASHEGASNGYC